MMNKNSKIYIAGHRGLVGSAIVRNLKVKGYTNLITRMHSELDLLDLSAVRDFFEIERPEYVFLAAAKAGGILANNTYRAQFVYENLQIQNNVIHLSHVFGVKKLAFLGSSCIYPKNCPQPIKEDYLLTSPLEYTNEPYAIAKIAGIKMCESYNLQYGTNFISVMPTNLYGENDNFNLETSHVLPALIRKFHLAGLAGRGDWEEIEKDQAVFGSISPDISAALGLPDKSPEKPASDADQTPLASSKASAGHIKSANTRLVTLWGTGTPRREFLHVDDMADACVFLMETVDFKDLVKLCKASDIRNTHVNIGSGQDVKIRDLAKIVKTVVGYEGDWRFDTDKPDGTPQKLLDVSRLQSLGWRHKIELEEGIKSVYEWYCRQKHKFQN
jgi:GDP-L-fucose synthase